MSKHLHAIGHSHAPHGRLDPALETSARGIRALKLSLLGLGATAVLQLLIVYVSGSVALLADTIHNFADAGTSIPLWIAFALVRRGASRRYTYGYGRAEDVAGMLIVLVIFASACVAAYEAAIKLIEPQPMRNAGWVAAAALIGFLGNEAVAVFRIRVGKEIGSAALVADGLHSRVDGFTSLSVLIGVVGVLIGLPVLDPLVGIGITVVILYIVKEAAISIGRRLMDGIEPEIVQAIEHAATDVPDVVDVQDLRARWLGHRVVAELTIVVLPGLTVNDAAVIAERLKESLREHVPSFGNALIEVREL